MRQVRKSTKHPAWILGTVILASLPLIGNAQQTFIVNTTDDTGGYGYCGQIGACSLRQALNNASGDGSAGTTIYSGGKGQT